MGEERSCGEGSKGARFSIFGDGGRRVRDVLRCRWEGNCPRGWRKIFEERNDTP